MLPADHYLNALHKKTTKKRNKDQEEMKNQMRENFGKSMTESVYAIRKFMARMTPSTTRRMISTAEKNLNHFCRTYFPPHIRLGTQQTPAVIHKIPTIAPFKARIFNLNHLQQHLRKTENIPKSGSQQGALLKKLPLSQRSTVRSGGNTMRYRKDYQKKKGLWSVMSYKGRDEYMGKRKKERNKSLFNLVM